MEGSLDGSLLHRLGWHEVHFLEECHRDGQTIEDGNLNVENDNPVLLYVYMRSILFSLPVYRHVQDLERKRRWVRFVKKWRWSDVAWMK